MYEPVVLYVTQEVSATPAGFDIIVITEVASLLRQKFAITSGYKY